jgi:cytochrome c oxidase assembly protein subunit 15
MTARSSHSQASDHDQAIRLWLLVVAALVFVMVLVGGATRLTDSGLSITEWKPVTGSLPPLSHAHWLEEFAKYRASPQYQAVNQGMSLADFQFIYWWEWGHRFLGRLIGAAMLLPWLVFVAKGWLRGRLAAITFGIGLMIGLQGLVGWLMVASGLKPGMVAVAPVKLMTHLVLACLILCALLWVALGLMPARDREPAAPVVRAGAIAMFATILVQIMLGALVAGNRAGLRFNDWPFMDGSLIPPAEILFNRPTIAEAFIDSMALTQFNHRLVAYGLLALAFWHLWTARGSAFAKGSVVLFGLVCAQAVIGIVTLMLVVPLWAGLLHQGFALLVLGHAVAHMHGATRGGGAAAVSPFARAVAAE